MKSIPLSVLIETYNAMKALTECKGYFMLDDCEIENAANARGKLKYYIDESLARIDVPVMTETKEGM